jgi:hypothetical protein
VFGRGVDMDKKQAYVVVRKFPFSVSNEDIVPKARENEILGCQSDKVRSEKFYAWKLLEEILQDKFDRNISEAYFDEAIGKWKMEGLYFSISHSFNVAAIAVSSSPIGIDVERMSADRFENLKVEKILNESESLLPLSLEDVCTIWSKKEAIFKTLDKARFVPRDIVVSQDVQSQIINVDGEEFVLSVASTMPEFVLQNECQ